MNDIKIIKVQYRVILFTKPYMQYSKHQISIYIIVVYDTK